VNQLRLDGKDPLRCATLTQPWCGLMAAEVKLIENRERPIIKRSAIGSQLGLHASREIDEAVYSRIERIWPVGSPDPNGGRIRWYQLSRITSAVLCVATLDRIITATGVDGDGRYTYARADLDAIGDQARWLFGRYGYVLRDVIRLREPTPCKGALGFWTLPTDVEASVRAQLAEAA
jgi:hypothetical protein